MKYKANPVEVDAWKIAKIISTNSDGSCIVELDDGAHRVASPGMCARIEPSVGDYWVIQSDGYIYLNPKDVFERKYSPIAE